MLCRLGEVKFAIRRGFGWAFADVCAHLMHLLVGGRERVSEGWAEAYAPKGSADGVVAADEAPLRPASTWICVSDVGIAQIQ